MLESILLLFYMGVLFYFISLINFVFKNILNIFINIEFKMGERRFHPGNEL
jgi:hypothetical protein